MRQSDLVERVAIWIYRWRWPDDPDCEQMGDQYRDVARRLIEETGLGEVCLP